METKTPSENILKFGKRTYFFDVKEASNGSTYLRITESRFVKEGEEHKRNSIILFKNDVDLFIEMLNKNKKGLKDVGKPKKE